MKAYAELKRRHIPTDVADEDLDYQPLLLPKASPRRLHAVSPLEMPKSGSLDVNETAVTMPGRDTQAMISKVATSLVIRPTFNKARTKRMTSPLLTTEEFIQVRLATVRESTRHCFWPTDVLAAFAAAEVIR